LKEETRYGFKSMGGKKYLNFYFTLSTLQRTQDEEEEIQISALLHMFE
jgi:hypothetical protein